MSQAVVMAVLFGAFLHAAWNVFIRACTAGSYGVALWAMTQAPIALVAALRETSVVFGTLMAACFLKERVTPWRYVSLAIVTVGAVAIKMS